MMHFIEHYLVAAVLFVAIDAVWLTTMSSTFYKKQLGGLLASKPNLVAAGIFYALYIVGMLVFAVNPGLGQHSFAYTAWHAALLGLVMYATYDLTNHSTLKNWPAKVTYVDMTWGVVLTTVVSSLTYLIFR